MVKATEKRRGGVKERRVRQLQVEGMEWEDMSLRERRGRANVGVASIG